ncbi:hypothetical protein [Enterobacter bugandensis]|uniref:hypothetical protein n=1 Tax=Enterobacter bugandensis TaxID=881260 RepID=UPI0020052200|nr:hypothetical protein [Enterobacter bugandensis]MCK6894610.1 hypothetical protein [Enterobacter bugandensis]
MLKMSKAKHAFLQRFYRFDEDIQLVDYLSWQSYSRSGVLNTSDTLLPGDISKYERLHKRNLKGKAFRENRSAVFTHLKQTIFSSYIKESYEEVTEYLKVILKSAALSKRVSILQFVGGQAKLTITALDIYQAGDFTSISNSLIDKIFQELEKERSTLKLIKSVCGKLSLSGEEKVINRAVHYLNIRHYLVHSDGKLPDEFVKELKENEIDISRDKNGYIKLNYELIKDFRSSVSSLVDHIDRLLIDSNFLSSAFIHRGKK